VKKYVELHVQQESTSAVVDQPRWSADDYMDKLSTIHGLMELVSNPFLLSIAVGALPKTIQSENDMSNFQLSSVQLYDTFTEQWLKRGKRKLQDRVLTSEEQPVFDSLCNAGFVEQGIIFQKKLAAAIFEHQKGTPVVEYFHFNINESDSWKTEFFGPAPEAAILREASPLIRSGNQHSFIHGSIMEYLYTRLFSESIDLGDLQPENRSKSVKFRDSLAEHPLNKNSVFEVPSILQFLVERVDSDPSFKTLLLDAVETSKKDKRVIKAATNAMSIMVKARVPFHGADLSGIKIPGALLQGGLFDSADFRGADLTGVNLSKAWLRKANLSGAIMEGVEFEELPHLQLDGGIKNCVFSFDGKLLFACSHQCSINVYDTTTWELKTNFIGKSAIAISPCGEEFINATLYNNADVVNVEAGEVEFVLSGHKDSIESICYSPDGGLIATGSKDKTVRIWRPADFDTDDIIDTLRVLHGHNDTVTGVAFSPSGELFTSCSMDMTIRITNTKTWSLAYNLDCAAPVLALAYSPDGHQLASCGQNADLRLWNTKSSNPDHLFLKGHTGTVFDVAYSPDGRRVASCGSDGTVRLWNSDSGDLFDSLPGDRYEANCVAFSPADNLVVSGGRDSRLRMWKTGDAPSANTLNNGLINRVNCVDISMNGEWIVTGCFGGAVQLWDTLTGKPGVMLEGHGSDVIGVAFSPSGKHVASNSTYMTVRLWCASTGQLVREFEGQAEFGKGLAFAPDGTHLITSYKQDYTLQVWDTQSDHMVASLRGHTSDVGGIIYSPIGELIASWSDDKTVRLWSTWTDKCLHILPHSEAVLNVAYSLNGQHLISSTAGGSRRWDARSGTPLDSDLRAIGPVIFWCSYSSDGKQLATVEVEKNRFHLWDTSSEEGRAILSTGIGLALQHVWRYHSKEKKMVLASIDTNFSLHVRELMEDVSGKDGKDDRRSYSDVRLMWNVGEGELSMEDAILEEVVGLSAANLKLMKQRADGVEKFEWSDESTEKYFRMWGYFDQSDDEEEEGVKAAEKRTSKEEKSEEKVKEKKEKVTMKEPNGSTSDSGMARALMKRAETLKRTVNDMQAEAMPPISTIQRPSTMLQQPTIQRAGTMPQVPTIQRASTMP
ncbi:Transducin (beta)-like 1 X-linked receptor 1, partial [Mortierella sp. AD032]